MSLPSNFLLLLQVADVDFNSILVAVKTAYSIHCKLIVIVESNTSITCFDPAMKWSY
jgi:hypothetical protein